MLGCGRKEVAKAELDAKVVATAAAYARKSQPTYCPTVVVLKADGWLADAVTTKDPWGTAFAIDCSGSIVTATSFGKDGARGTSDDIRATAVVGAWSPARPSPAGPSDPPPSRNSPSVSETGTIGRPGQVGRTFLFERKEDYDESITLVVAKDHDGYGALVRGSAMACEPGTRVRVLESTWTGTRRVRIIDGPFSGKSGWVAAEEIQREAPTSP